MKIFNRFNQQSKCKICGTNKKGKAVLIPISGTNEGNLARAEQVHLDCINLCFIYPTDGKNDALIFQHIREAKQ